MDRSADTPVTVERALDAIRTVLAQSGREHVEVTPLSTLEDLDLSSLDVADVFVTLEVLCGCELEPVAVGEFVNVGDLVKLRPAVATPVSVDD